jgi:hypothetical protein
MFLNMVAVAVMSSGKAYARKMLTGVNADSRTGPRMTATIANDTMMITRRTAKSPLEKDHPLLFATDR